MNIELYIDNNNEHWVIRGEQPLFCDVTNEILEKICFVVSYLDSQLGNRTVLLSLNGLRKLKTNYAQVVVYTQATITKTIGYAFKRVFHESLELKAGTLNRGTTFSAASETSEEPDNWDEAPLSKKGVSFEGASVGAPLIEENKLDDDEFGLIMSASPVEDKVLEDKSKDEGVDDESRRID